MSNKPIYEIFEEIEATRAKKKRVEVLQANDSEQLRLLLDYVYNPNIKWILTDLPEFKSTKDAESASAKRLYNKVRKLIYLTNLTPYPDAAKGDRIQIYKEILESIHPKDAAIVYGAIKDKEIPYDRIDVEIVSEAFPELTKTWK
ncbi:DNA ligase [Ochrobactrum phage vB_OspM_OC]|nr:DNA ligase [Ochrobactrum phage vB_OspM_OC]